MNNYNICKQCTYFIQECDNNAICCKDESYQSVKPNQYACNDFTQDNLMPDNIQQYIDDNEPDLIDDNIYDELF